MTLILLTKETSCGLFNLQLITCSYCSTIFENFPRRLFNYHENMYARKDFRHSL